MPLPVLASFLPSTSSLLGAIALLAKSAEEIIQVFFIQLAWQMQPI